MKNFEDVQVLGKDNLDATMKSFGAYSKTAQTIAVEMTEYSKKSFEEGTKALEQLLGAKTLEQAVQIQTDYAKTAYESFIAEATKIGALYVDLAKGCYQPFENNLSRSSVSMK